MYFIAHTESDPVRQTRERDCVPQPLVEQLQVFHSDNYGWALLCCAWDTPVADDVLQEAYLRVLDGRARFQGGSTAKTWFFAVIKRVAQEQLRRRRSRQSLLMRLLPAVSEDDAVLPAESMVSSDPVANAEISEAALALRAALMQLPERQREVLHLVFYSELTLAEAAHTLAVSLGTARTHYHRAKQSLATLLSDDDQGREP